MKYLKMTFVFFIICLVVSMVSANASTYLGVLGIKVPALKGIVTLNEDTDGNITYTAKEQNLVSQKYYSTDTIVNNLSGSSTDVQVRIKNTSGGTTNWLTLGADEEGTFTNQYYAVLGNYTLQFRQSDYRANYAMHSGIWYHY